MKSKINTKKGLVVSTDSYLRYLGGAQGYYEYLCTLCGNSVRVSKKYTPNYISKSCGCITDLKPRGKDFTGNYINGILIIGYRDRSFWKIRYECGCEAFSKIGGLKNNKQSKCKICMERVSGTLRHGHQRRGCGTRTHSSWSNMKSRCYYEQNSRYVFYGGKGIKVCDRWLNSFENFLEDMGECPEHYSLERKNIKKDYNKTNCKWADNKEQANNKSNNILITNGIEVMSLKHWCGLESVDYSKAHYRYRYKNESISAILGDKYQRVENKT